LQLVPAPDYESGTRGKTLDRFIEKIAVTERTLVLEKPLDGKISAKASIGTTPKQLQWPEVRLAGPDDGDPPIAPYDLTIPMIWASMTS